jgi:vitamin B12 transporter
LKTKPVALALAISAAFGCAQAQSVQTLDPVVVTAAGFEQNLSMVIPSTTVVTRDQIDQSGALSLADLIYAEPGVEFGRNGGLGTTTSFFLRGAESKNVLVLVDGVRMRDGVTQSALAENIPLSQIEQVEIVRGNVSAIYGDGAVGGVINVITRSPGDMGTSSSTSAMIGARNTRDISAHLIAGNKTDRISVMTAHTKTDGFSATNTRGSSRSEDSDKDGYENNSLGLQYQKQVSQDLKVQLNYLATRSRLDYDSSWGSGYPKQEVDNDLIRAKISYRFNPDRLLGISASHNKIDLSNNQGTHNVTQIQQTDLTLDQKIDLENRLRLGLDRRVDRRSPADSGLGERTFHTPSIGLYRDTAGYSAQLNLRHDQVEDGEEKTTWLIGLAMPITMTLKWTATVASAFRLPDGYALSTNGSLRSEQHKSLETGLSFQAKGMVARAVVFKTRTNNPIYYDSSDWTYKNSAYMENQGLEGSLVWSMSPSWTLDGSLTLQSPKSPHGDSLTMIVQSARRAKVFGSLGLTHEWDQHSIAVKVNGASRRRDSDYDAVGEFRLKGYATVSAAYTRKIDKTLKLIARVDNVFDQSYELAYGYNTPSRGVFLGIQFNPS